MCLRGLASSRTPQRRRWLRYLAIVAIVATALIVPPATAGATIGTDDYPPRLKRAAQNALVDPWHFYNRECTSFVAWRLNNDAGVAFHNYYLGKHWGDASNWRQAADQAGVPVDEIPAVGAVAWWRGRDRPDRRAATSRGSRAHQGPRSPSRSTTTSIAGHYDTRTIDSGSSVWPSAFIHIGDISIRSDTPPTVNGTAQVGRD